MQALSGVALVLGRVRSARLPALLAETGHQLLPCAMGVLQVRLTSQGHF